jgi:DNA polymerase-3 subunit gamma/tau
MTISPSREWGAILAKLELTGMAQALAANCTLESFIDNQLTLTLATQHQPMFNKKLLIRIEEALTNHFNKPIKLDIKFTSSEIDTPSKLQHQEQVTRHTQATQAIKSDSEVQKIINIFNATLDIDSIQTI